MKNKKLNEQAKDYVWGVKGLQRVGNIYSIKPLKKPPQEKKVNG